MKLHLGEKNSGGQDDRHAEHSRTRAGSAGASTRIQIRAGKSTGHLRRKSGSRPAAGQNSRQIPAGQTVSQVSGGATAHPAKPDQQVVISQIKRCINPVLNTFTLIIFGVWGGGGHL